MYQGKSMFSHLSLTLVGLNACGMDEGPGRSGGVGYD